MKHSLAELKENDLEPSMEMFAFKIGMTHAEFHEAIYAMSPFRRPDGGTPWFGMPDDMAIQAQSYKLETGKPRRITAFFGGNRQTSQIDIEYHAVAEDARIQLFHKLYSNLVNHVSCVMTHTNERGELLYLFDADTHYVWLFNPAASHNPIKISLRQK